MRGSTQLGWWVASVAAVALVGCRPQAEQPPKAPETTEPAVTAPPAARHEAIVVPPASKPAAPPPDADLASPPRLESKPLDLPAAESPASPAAVDPSGQANPLRSDAAPLEAPPSESRYPGEPGTLSPGEPAKLVPVASSPAEPPKRTGKHSGIPFDPIKENGPIFEGWPKPKLAFLITGREEGYLEPCGCAGLDRMKGGMARRHTLFRTLRDKQWPLVGLDVGGNSKGFGKQVELKFRITVEGMLRMGFDAIGLGAAELKLPAGELVSVAAATGEKPTPFVSANVHLYQLNSGLTPKWVLVERPGAKLAVTSVLGDEYRKQLQNNEIGLVDAEKALREVLPAMKKNANYLVLLANATLNESTELANKFPEFNLVVSAGGPAEPPGELQLVKDTKTVLVTVGEKGMNAVVVAFFSDPKTPVRYQRIPLDSRFESSQEMRLLMAAYQEQLAGLGLSGLNVKAVPHPQGETNGKFVGTEKCASCHEESMRVWKKSGHAKAWETLTNLDIPRDHDPECISCHVVGWHPTKYFPYESGFKSQKETPHLVDVGCESCHGPGEKHVAAEMGADLALQERLRKALVVTKKESAERQCYTCHDLDNSPDFDFESYWPLVEHHED